MSIQLLGEQRCFSGRQLRYEHQAQTVNCTMRFSVFLPPQAASGEKLPVVYWLSGLTCTDENFVQKAGAQRMAAEKGLILVAPDTSPRGEGVPDDANGAWDFGLGAGFYVNATEAPWHTHYQMFDYVTQELPALIQDNFATNGKQSIMGHSMGGHGALVCALRLPHNYASVSAFAPIVNSSDVPWGQKALELYLGNDKQTWQDYDTCALIEKAQVHLPMLIDQGSADGFMPVQLQPEVLQMVAKKAQYPITIRQQDGYDHSYFFIASFIDEHLAFHAKALGVL